MLFILDKPPSDVVSDGIYSYFFKAVPKADLPGINKEGLLANAAKTGATKDMPELAKADQGKNFMSRTLVTADFFLKKMQQTAAILLFKIPNTYNVQFYGVDGEWDELHVTKNIPKHFIHIVEYEITRDYQPKDYGYDKDSIVSKFDISCKKSSQSYQFKLNINEHVAKHSERFSVVTIFEGEVLCTPLNNWLEGTNSEVVSGDRSGGSKIGSSTCKPTTRRKVFTGPNGGRYYLSNSNKKVYF